MAYQIDKGVPMPPISRGKGRLVYPWDEMEVGDSFVPMGKNAGRALVISATKYRPGKAFEARTVKGATRIWRTA